MSFKIVPGKLYSWNGFISMVYRVEETEFLGGGHLVYFLRTTKKGTITRMGMDFIPYTMKMQEAGITNVPDT